MKTLSELGSGKGGVITRLDGGQSFRQRVETMGIRVGKHIKVIARQPHGPVVVDIGGCQITMGRGMASKIIVE